MWAISSTVVIVEALGLGASGMGMKQIWVCAKDKYIESGLKDLGHCVDLTYIALLPLPLPSVQHPEKES